MSKPGKSWAARKFERLRDAGTPAPIRRLSTTVSMPIGDWLGRSPFLLTVTPYPVAPGAEAPVSNNPPAITGPAAGDAGEAEREPVDRRTGTQRMEAERARPAPETIAEPQVPASEPAPDDSAPSVFSSQRLARAKRADQIKHVIADGRARGQSFSRISVELGAAGVYVAPGYLRKLASRLGLTKAHERADGPGPAKTDEPPPAAPIVPSSAARGLAAAASAIQARKRPPQLPAVVEKPKGTGAADAGRYGNALMVAPQRVQELTRIDGIPTRALILATEYAMGARLVDLTPSLMGDPPPGFSALDRRASGHGEAPAAPPAPPDELFVEGYMGGVHSADAEFPACFTSKGAAYKAGWLRGRQDRGRVQEVA